MGYNSYLNDSEYNLTDIEGLKKELQKLEADKDSFLVKNIGSGEIYVNLKGYLEVNNPDGKWYEEWTLPLMELLSKHGNGRIIFEGEDGIKWCYELDGKGGFLYKDGLTIYGSLEDEFYKQFSEEMPDKLKEMLKTWLISRKV